MIKYCILLQGNKTSPSKKDKWKAAFSYNQLETSHLSLEVLTIVTSWFIPLDRPTDFHSQVQSIGLELRNLNLPISLQNIGKFFGIDRGTIRKYINEEGRSENQRERPFAITEFENDAISYFIFDCYEKRSCNLR
jgi:hypothetical protein